MTQNSRAPRSILILSAILGSVLQLAAASPILEWDPSYDPEVTGYKVYRGEKSRAYDHVFDVGAGTSIALTNLDPGITYYFAITAYAGNSAESDYSEEIYYTSKIDGITAIGKPCYFSLANGIPRISFYGNAGDECWVEASTDFDTWERVHSGQVPVDGIFQVTDETIENRTMRFYRVVTSLH